VPFAIRFAKLRSSAADIDQVRIDLDFAVNTVRLHQPGDLGQLCTVTRFSSVGTRRPDALRICQL
jgi:hypothetical protein